MPLRIVFFGTPEFAVPTLAALIASSHAVTAVVTQPDDEVAAIRPEPTPAGLAFDLAGG